MPIDRDVPLWFLNAAFLPDDWIAVLLKRPDTGEAVQRVGPVAMVLDGRFQSWLRFKNAQRFDVFVSVNALTPGRRSRARESVSAVRHLFLDADRNADGVLGAIRRRLDLPSPSCVVRSSVGRAHVLWRIETVSCERAEAVQRHLAQQLGTDLAATSAAQMTRLPGFFNHKYKPPQLVVFWSTAREAVYDGHAFPEVPTSYELSVSTARRDRPQTRGMPMVERARRYLEATPPAVEGQHGDLRTFVLCCRLLDRFELCNDEALTLLEEWNARCRPPWSKAALASKLRSARRQAPGRASM